MFTEQEIQTIIEKRIVRTIVLKVLNEVPDIKAFTNCNKHDIIKDEENWITINGTRVRLDDDGNLTGAVGEKINAFNAGKVGGGSVVDMSENFVDGASVESQLQEQSDIAFGRFSDEEKKAVEDYVDFSYQPINGYLRGHEKRTRVPGFDAQEAISHLDSAMDKFDLTEDVIVYRGDSIDIFAGRNVGDELVIPQFMSTSINTEYAQDFNGPFFAEIRVPRGTKSLYLGNNSQLPEESELLLSRGLRYKVIDRTGNTTVLEVVR